MYVLYADDHKSLDVRTHLFAQHMEPLLRALEGSANAGKVPSRFVEIPQYLQVCRWPFRKLEYSYALEALLEHLQPSGRYLDAGCGVTPLAHAIAGCGVHADACDSDIRLIAQLRALGLRDIYGSDVAYATQDLTALTYADATFDAVSCISVLEHIPAPLDQRAIAELLRVLKPGGLLVLTVDFTPLVMSEMSNQVQYAFQRAINLARRGEVREIGRGIARRARARQVAKSGVAHRPRTANQCFEVVHLEEDIVPALTGAEVLSHLPFSQELRSITSMHARRFWDLEAGLYDNQGRRAVLPAAISIRKMPREASLLGDQRVSASV